MTLFGVRFLERWGGGGAMFKTVLLCYDGSTHDRCALKRGADLVALVGAEVHVLAILASDSPSPTLIAASAGHVCLFDEELNQRGLLDESITRLNARGLKATGHLVQGDTLEQIASYAKRLAADLIVLGHYPRPGARRWWSGSERGSLAERVQCCILIAVNGGEIRVLGERSLEPTEAAGAS